MKLVVGLGNYGDRYKMTYHNMGFMAADSLAERLNTKFKTKECDSLTASANYKGEKIIIAKPLTYMNLSGQAVKSLIKRYKIELSDLIVIFDDIDIERGKIRKRESGSGGTHNGMRSIIELIKSEDFKRVRIGIGRPEANINLADYVLSKVDRTEVDIISAAVESAVDGVLEFISGN